MSLETDDQKWAEYKEEMDRLIADREAAFQERMKHRGTVVLNEQDISEMIQLPEGYFLVGVGYNSRTMSIELYVVGDDLPEVSPMCEAPMIDKLIHVAECSDGRVHISFDFPTGKTTDKQGHLDFD